MFKKPYFRALCAAGYIALIVSAVNLFSANVEEESIFAPMAILSLLVFSVALMGFIFFFEPLKIYIDGKKSESVRDFFSTLGIFAGFMLAFMLLFFLI